MRKLIHSNFELDLSDRQLSDNEENNWFSDSFFTKYSFPFDLDLDNDMDEATGYISQMNASNLTTYFEVKYVHNNKIEDAILEIESYETKLSCVVRYGFEQLPSFDKKLSELNLQKFDLDPGTTIYEHAETIITKTWPEVNYNFPQVHTDKYDTEDALWTGFKKIINNRESGAFLENSVDTVEDISYNRNIMQPYPYVLHVLKVIMSDSGYTLSGDILNDELFKKALLFNSINYYKTREFSDQNIIKEASQYYETVAGGGVVRGRYETILHLQPGKYEVFGNINLKGRSFGGIALAKISLNGVTLWSEATATTTQFNVSVPFENTINDNELRIYAISRIDSENFVFDLTLARLYDYDSGGLPIPTILNENKIDLPKSTPNMLVQDFIKIIKNWFNYDLDVVGNNAIMNKIESKITYTDAIDLQDTEIKVPLKKYQSGISFLLKFQDTDNDKFKYLPVFQNQTEVLNENFKINEKTTTIEINALPLPQFKREGVTTAYSFEDNDSKVYLIVYDGILNGNNYCRPETDLLLPSVHENYWFKWFQFRIKAIPFTWNFKKWMEDIFELRAKSKVFAYNKYHIIKTINKTEVKPDLYDIEIETETLE